ncbi:hypothetical protein [Inconstantimicrobium mannanitabidum]|uniref:Uncharacterized protein n=1 Tax=Inconstantimicrobium mannanitabidum TaxID=1604901 RepID=A0ACB5R9F3_9CLOT|nr:hypothetical protein [Clostridium sp. TW13]GKX65666.1 hypothetical protein rsdtw13_09240 [Clostridium sp. TW13]
MVKVTIIEPDITQEENERRLEIVKQILQQIANEPNEPDEPIKSGNKK